MIPGRHDREITGPLVVGLGECLYDCFADRKELGGAPVNLSVHADALLKNRGGAGVPATRVGDDALGVGLLRELAERGVSRDAVQIDPAHPTGTVNVEIDEERHATYRFASDVAWDHLEPTIAWDSIAGRCHAVAFGTLAQRSPVSRDTIHRFLAQAKGAVKLFDVNLRQDYYSAEVVERSLEMATAVKLNAEELGVVYDLLDLDGVGQDADRQASLLCLTFGLDWLALTRGAEGTLLYTQGGRYESERIASVATDEADTVGAGDACCAGLMAGVLLGWAPQRTVELANRLGAFVASCPGATPKLPDGIIQLTTDQPDLDQDP